MLMNHVYKPSQDARFPRRWVDMAVALAMENRWEEAAALNQRILSAAPEDLGSLNRLGRALMELGQYDRAKEAYMKTLALSPSNTIAEKNLARLSALHAETSAVATPAKVDLKMFLAEPGKATVTTIGVSGDAVALAKIAVGEQVDLVVTKRALQVHDARGALLGAVERRLAHRIIELIKGGNRYDAALVSADGDVARVVVRETYQDATQLGKLSFPPHEIGTGASDLKDDLPTDDGDEEESAAEDATEEAEETVAGADEVLGQATSSDDRFLF